jgi:hypothetical protein
VRRLLRLVSLAIALGCSSLDEGETTAVSLEVITPSPPTIEVGEQLQLSARALNADGQVVEVPVSWQVPASDAAFLAVDQTSGVITGLSPGTGRVQASTGSLSSDLLQFNVIAPADTLIIVGDSVIAVPVEPGVTQPLVVRLESFHPPSVLDSRPVVYEITRPVGGDPPVVVLSGGVQAVTSTTGGDGTVSTVVLSRTPGTIAPDTTTVEVRATRTRGTAVPGSGQRFIVVFQ